MSLPQTKVVDFPPPSNSCAFQHATLCPRLEQCFVDPIFSVIELELEPVVTNRPWRFMKTGSDVH